jgi:hypothetical protein
MRDAEIIVAEVKQFILEYIENSQARGPMYGSIRELESNWTLLNQVLFIANDTAELHRELSFSRFLASEKGFGAKGASMVIDERGSADPYRELGDLWREYVKWRDQRLAVSQLPEP